MGVEVEKYGRMMTYQEAFDQRTARRKGREEMSGGERKRAGKQWLGSVICDHVLTQLRHHACVRLTKIPGEQR